MVVSLLTHFKRFYLHTKEFHNHLLSLAFLQAGVAIFDLLGITFLYISLVTFFTGRPPDNIPGALSSLMERTGFGIGMKNWIVALTFIILLIQMTLGIVKVYYTSWLGRSVHQFFTTQINEKILCSSYSDMITRSSGELTLALGDESYNLGQTVIDLSEAISTLMIICLYFLAICYISIWFEVFLFLTLCSIGSFTFLTIRIGRNFVEKGINQSKKLYSVMFDLINNMKAIRLFNNEESEIRKYERIFSRYRFLHVMKDLFAELTSVIPLFILYIIVFGFYFSYYRHSQFSSGSNPSLALLLFGYTSRILIGSKNFVSRLGSAISNAQSGKDVFEILELSDAEVSEEKTILKLDFVGEVQFEKINFSHEGQIRSLFTDLNVSIPFGKHIAIVGETGSGKSTFLDIYIGLLQPSSGRILVSGKDLQHINQRLWRSKVVYVNQEISLFNDSIYNNLTYGAIKSNRDKVIHYSQIAHCHEFITTLPDGYDTILHYQAKNLSGGQKQRLLIAHALICEPEVLILDESTSSLDEYTQGIIMRNLRHLFRNKTFIVVTHKSEMLEFFDHIIRLDKGTVTFEGNVKKYMSLFSNKVSS